MNSYQQPDASGHFGPYGGSFVSETLTHAIQELRDAYARYQNDPEFLAEFQYELKHFVGRPSPIYHAARTSREMGGAQIYLKREDLNHTGAHKINNVIGQAMLAKRMGKPRVIAETGAGQHGVATATICARYGLECVVYMGAEDVKRQSPNVYRMKLLGATVVPVESGSKTLKDALNDAMRDWVANVDNTFYIIGTVAGPHHAQLGAAHTSEYGTHQSTIAPPTQMKRLIDLLLAAVACVLLALPLLIIALWIRLTSPGPALYWSQRVGRNNRLFAMPKFRSMRIDTPEVATHLLENPAQWLIPIGSFLRRSSLDELPQLWSILRGDMSLVGPRPALHNQHDLIAQRTQAGVHMLRPGLTGWAQINGRDELPIAQKVALDAWYLEHRSLALDVRILLRTVLKVLRRDGVSH